MVALPVSQSALRRLRNKGNAAASLQPSVDHVHRDAGPVLSFAVADQLVTWSVPAMGSRVGWTVLLLAFLSISVCSPVLTIYTMKPIPLYLICSLTSLWTPQHCGQLWSDWEDDSSENQKNPIAILLALYLPCRYSYDMYRLEVSELALI